MRATSFFILFLCLDLSKSLFLNGHNKLMEQFRESAKSLDLSNIVKKRIKQPIDHFDKSDTRVWYMRYLKNMENLREGGPVYIFIGGEGEINRACLASGLLYELAEETNGAMFATEHRYYGKSKPFEEVSRKNIHYLSSEQALADIANFIKIKIKNKATFKKSKVVVIGGSYGGNLAAWMRLRYPELVDAAIASSAPVLAKLDFKEFLETVGTDFKRFADPKCFLYIQETFKSYSNDLENEIGMEKLKNEHNICVSSDLSKWENQAEFFDERVHSLIPITQHGTSADIKHYCNVPTQGFCKKPDGCCKLEFDELYYERSTNALVHEKDFWTYQLCNEFGHFFTAPLNPPLKGITLNVDYSIKICRRLFGEVFSKEYIEERIKDTNDKYGGLTPDVTNVIFVHGQIDPWKRRGVVKKLSKKALAKVIKGASHCNDLLSNNAHTTTDQVKQTKEWEKAIIKKWIGIYK